MPAKGWTIALCMVLLSSTASLADEIGVSEPGAIERGTEIPFKLYNDHLIIVKGTLGSVEGVNIMLDTGKSPTAIDKRIAGRLHLQGNHQSMLLSNGTLEVLGAVVPRVRIGAWQAESLRVVVQDLAYLEQKLGIWVAGIAGLDILGRKSFLVDYERKRIVFGEMRAPANTVSCDTRLPFLTIKAAIDGQEVRLLVDSGTSGLLLYRDRLNVKLEPLPRDPDAVIATAAGRIRTQWALASSVRLGSKDLGPNRVLLADVDPGPAYKFDGLMGFRGLGFRRAWLDLEHGILGWE
jgi:predicted aspartyl protease